MRTCLILALAVLLSAGCMSIKTVVMRHPASGMRVECKGEDKEAVQRCIEQWKQQGYGVEGVIPTFR